jgi:hypothetical protein
LFNESLIKPEIVNLFWAFAINEIPRRIKIGIIFFTIIFNAVDE